MLVHKTSRSKFKKTEIIQSIFSNYHGMKLEVNNRRKTRKLTNTWKLNNTLLNNQWIKEEIKEETERYLETNEIENTHTKTYGMQKKQF